MTGHDLVVVGASAGGVEALIRLAQLLPADLPAAVMIVLHLHPASPEVLPKILSRHAALPVMLAQDGEVIRPGRIYIARPDCHLLVEDGTLRLGHGPREHFCRPAVDPLFRTAAEASGPRVVGVVLTGAGANGTLGLLAIKRGGGVTMAQDPKEALWPSMPSSAIRCVGVDYVLPLAELAKKLVELVLDPPGAAPGSPSEGSLTPAEIDAILAQVEGKELGEADEPGGEALPAYTCPECGAMMTPVGPEGLALFRCGLGHFLSGEDLLTQQFEALEMAVWTAVRLADQKAYLGRHLGRLCRESQGEEAAKGFESVADLAERYSRALRQFIETVRLP